MGKFAAKRLAGGAAAPLDFRCEHQPTAHVDGAYLVQVLNPDEELVVCNAETTRRRIVLSWDNTIVVRVSHLPSSFFFAAPIFHRELRKQRLSDSSKHTGFSCEACLMEACKMLFE
ncbi:hypothetical protein Q3G72_021082 [Acer saccharum]|nr:hypothetical protein Q3G72_021082 [Acer saccharum]